MRPAAFALPCAGLLFLAAAASGQERLFDLFGGEPTAEQEAATTTAEAATVDREPARRDRPSWQRVHEALAEETTFEFIEMPLKDAVAYFADLHKVPVAIDREALADAGLSEELAITNMARGVSLSSALTAMLRGRGLGFINDGERLLITTAIKTQDHRFEAALEQETQVHFVEVPLNDVVAFFEELHKIPIEIDIKSLDEAGLGGDVPVTREVSELTLASALNLILNDLELTYIIENEVMLITTLAAAEKRPCVKFYPVGKLIESGLDLESLKRLIKLQSEGDCDTFINGHLAVFQSQPAHRKTARLIRELSAVAGAAK
jgi:hypothetical protein